MDVLKFIAPPTSRPMHLKLVFFGFLVFLIICLARCKVVFKSVGYSFSIIPQLSRCNFRCFYFILGAEEIYNPTWYAYEIMESFLLPVYTCNEGINTETVSK